MKYDLLLSGGFVIDPRNNVNQICDVAVKDGKLPKSHLILIEVRLLNRLMSAAN